MFNRLKNLKIEDLYTSVKPLTYLSFFSGLAPFKRNAQKEFEAVSGIGLVFTVVQLMIFLYCFVTSIGVGETIIGHFFKSSITQIGNMAQVVAEMVATVTILVLSFVNRQKLVDIFRKINDVDKCLEKLGQDLDYQQIFKYSVITAVCITIFNVAYLGATYGLLHSAEMNPSLSIFITFAIPHINICLTVFKFISITNLIKRRFAMINKVSITFRFFIYI